MHQAVEALMTNQCAVLLFTVITFGSPASPVQEPESAQASQSVHFPDQLDDQSVWNTPSLSTRL